MGPRPILIAGAYALVAVVMTWPLAPRMATSIAADLGDPVFNCWVLLWTSGQVFAALTGDRDALGRYWHGNIFHPEPNTLAYSEHLTPQMLQALPVLALTGNVVLAYNLLFLSTFVLCGLGVYLLVRDLTSRPLAAFAAGLAFAWAPYRIAQVPHLQVLSSYWMPLAFVGLHRYFATRRLRPLCGGATALALQNLSCGYFLLYFPPFLAAYCLSEMTRRRLLGAWRVWLALAAAAAAVALITWPFLEPYLALRAAGEVGVRHAGEIQSFSADVWAFGQAPPSLRLWGGTMSAFPKPEGEGFPGLMTATLAGVAIGLAAWRAGAELVRRPVPTALRVIAAAAAVVLAVSATIGLWIVTASGLRFVQGGVHYVFYNPTRPLSVALGASIVLALALARARRGGLGASSRGPVLFFASALLVAALLSFGPTVMSAGRPVMPGPYGWLLAYVPGFDGSRVPARFLMLVALFLSVLAGLGLAALMQVWRRAATALAVAAALAILVESWIVPFSIDVPAGVPAELISPTGLRTGRAMSPLYRAIRDLPDPVVLIEFPFGEPTHDLQAMFSAGYHRRPLVNGYSGFLPPNYTRRAGALWNPVDDPARAARWLADSAATHALVHEAWFAGDRGAAVSAWLEGLGARLMTRDGPDKLFQLQ